MTFHIAAEESSKNIDSVDKHIQKNTNLLEELYQELELKMEQGFHPNSVRERINSLRELREMLNAAKRANLPIGVMKKEVRPLMKRNAAPNEVPIEETEFFQHFARDLSIAKSKVEIYSPFIGIERSRQVLPILARLVADGRNVVVRTRPADEHDGQMKHEQHESNIGSTPSAPYFAAKTKLAT